MKHFYLIIILLFSTKTQSQVYFGKIDKFDIYLNLDHPLDEFTTIYGVTYFYQSKLQNVWLDGIISRDSVILYRQYTEKEDAEELFLLKKQGDDLVGTWSNNGKQFEVNLKPSQEDLSFFKTEQFDFIRDSISSFQDKELVWFTEKYSKTSLFRLGNGFSNNQRIYFNEILDRIQFVNAQTVLDCQYTELYTEITLLSEQYISFLDHSEVDCGGVHPNHGLDSYNFDLKNIKLLESINEVYPNLDFVKLLEEKYANSSDLIEECEYFSGNNNCWEYANWVFVKDGIEIIPYFPHVMTPCIEAFPISFEEIKVFQNK